MGNVGGSRTYKGAGLPGQGWQCPICGHLNIVNGPCAKCQDDPSWAPAPPKATGLAAAKATFKKLTEQVIAAEPEPQTEHVSLNIDARIGDGLTTLMLTGPSGEPYAGSGVTLQEALISALAAMEEDLNRPKCPTCGQGWPEHLEYPTEE